MLLSISPGIKYNRGSEVKLCVDSSSIIPGPSRRPFAFGSWNRIFRGCLLFPPVFNFRTEMKAAWTRKKKKKKEKKIEKCRHCLSHVLHSSCVGAFETINDSRFFASMNTSAFF
ncbi:hypothetical protein CEXT_679011 [Caerostris extrusa]|uniref:Uncharacterized protein n=1 Tax=Caerostris extrusa TaxID=172846 RepID=A0AAV4Y2W2_CAEEX|nr:hypothetical protein CEXT_679011 [Caerostris extrusa]